HDNPRMMRYLELREQRVPVPEERWQEDVYTWEEWPFYPSEEEAWGLLIFLIMEGKVEEFGQFGFDGYVKERIQRLMLTFPSNMTLEANNKSEDWRKKQPEARARYEATQLIHATEDLLNLGLILSYAPVQTPSGKYQDVEYNRRTYADLRGELAHKLTNLAQYTFIIHRAGHQDVTPVLHVPIQSRFKESDIQAMYRVSREEIGREWSEVEAEIVNRRVPVQPAPAQKPIEPSGLPPAKPSI
ncbi:MAG: hypothetical protein ACXVLT_15825, partial [Flavisolibacter sp.]